MPVLGPALLLDLVVVLLLVSQVVRGWRQGLMLSGLSLAGLVGGVILGVWGGPRLLALLPAGSLDSLEQAALLILAVIVAASIGSAIGSALGARLRAPEGALRGLDALLGAAGAGVVTVLVLGVLAAAVKPIAPASWVATMDASRTLPVIGGVLPDEAVRQASRLTDVLDAAGFPRVFGGLTPEPSIPARAPDESAAATPAVEAAADSVLLVAASAAQCGGPGALQVGSGWVAAPERVVTNAHVVAGSDGVTVQVQGVGRPHDATVVALDPDIDLAVLAVPGLDADPLPRATGELDAGASIAVAGFPGGGPYTVAAGRVRGVIDARGDDIYGTAGVDREVYAVRVPVEQGNSGGPLLTTDGEVAGTVFAKSLSDLETAYALTDAQTDALIADGTAASAGVPTGRCARG